MAKKRRNTKKKHNDQEQSSDFLADVPETSSEEWANNDQDQTVVDPYAEQMEAGHHQEEAPVSTEPVYEDEASEEESYEPVSEGALPTEEHLEEMGTAFSLGNFLRDQREGQGISLKNVSQSTKISITNLEYLEEDDLHSLPDRAYVTGYVKSYARLLGTDVNFCLDLLDKTYQSQGAAPREPEIVIPQAQNSPQINDGFPVAKAGAIAGMIIVIVAIVGFFMTRDSSETPEEPKVAVQEPVKEEAKEITPQTLSAETPLQEEISQQEEEPAEEEVAESVPATPTPVVKKEEEKKPEPVEEEKKVAEVKKEEDSQDENEEEEKKKEKRKFYPLAAELYSEDTAFSQDKIDQLLPSQFRVSPVEGIQAVFITAVKGDSWLTYKSDDDPIKKFVLKEGRSLLFRSKEARVFLGNLGAVKIFLNNKPLKVTSRTGVKSLVFPQENSSKYVMPLFIYKEDGTVQTSSDWIEENE